MYYSTSWPRGDAVFSDTLHPSGVEELPGVASVIVDVERAQDFADA